MTYCQAQMILPQSPLRSKSVQGEIVTHSATWFTSLPLFTVKTSLASECTRKTLIFKNLETTTSAQGHWNTYCHFLKTSQELSWHFPAYTICTISCRGAQSRDLGEGGTEVLPSTTKMCPPRHSRPAFNCPSSFFKQ